VTQADRESATKPDDLPDTRADPPDRARGRFASVATKAKARFEGSALQRIVRQLNELDFANRIVLFGSSLLLSVLPFVILMSTFANERIDDDIARHIGLDPRGSRIIAQLFQASPRHPVAAVVTAMIVAVAGTVGVAGSLQGIYESVFDQPRRGMRDIIRFLIWVGALFGALLTEALISAGMRSVPARPLVQGVLVFAGVTAFFWWTMHFLLAGRVRWRVLLPSAIFTGIFWVVLEGVGSIYFSSSIDSDNDTYGKIGVVFTLATWFIAVGAVIVLGTVLGSAFNLRKRRKA
jgi:membrane protein